MAGLLRTDVVLIETVKNMMGSFDKRAKLARGFGLSLDSFDAYLNGQLALSDALARSSSKVKPSTGTSTSRGFFSLTLSEC